MVRKYMRKTSQQKWSEDDMKNAVLAVREGKMSFKMAAETYNVPCTTLFRRSKKDGDPKFVSAKQLGRFRNVFTETEEQDLVNHCLFLEQRLFGLRVCDLRTLAYQFAEQNKKSHPFNVDKGRAGKDWVEAFLKRHPELSLRTPENTSLARASAFNKENVNAFFTLLITLQEKFNFSPSRIYNVDETGITTVPNKPSKIISLKGKKQVGNVTSAERGVTTTAAIWFNAAGQYIPPLLIFPRIRENTDLLIGAPPETVLVCHSSGWMQTEIFYPKWFEHFLRFSKPSPNDPVLLILDGHATHTKNVQLLESARKNNVHILCIPPHTSHRLQPLDVSFMFPLSTFYTQECETWMRQNPGRSISIRQVGSLFGKAYLKAATPTNAINGFKKTGIFPLDPNIFPEEAFAASATTDREFLTEPAEVSGIIPMKHAELIENQNENCSDISNGVFKEKADVFPSLTDSPVTLPVATASCSFQPRPSKETEKNRKYISPQVILPAPKVKPSNEGRKTSKIRGKTAIFTSSPYLLDLQEKMANQKIIKPRKLFVNKVQLKKPKNKPDDVKDNLCLICGENFFKSKPGEEWITCSICHLWAHEECSGFDTDNDKPYVCDFC